MFLSSILPESQRYTVLEYIYELCMTPALNFMGNFDFRLVHDFSFHVGFHFVGVWVNL